MNLEEMRQSDAYWSAPPKTDFIDQISSIMRAKGVPQVELARRLGVSQPQVSRVLSGDNNPSLTTMVRFAKALNRTVRISIEGYDPR